MAKKKTIDINSRLSTEELKKDVETAVTELNKVKDAAEGKDPKTGKDITASKKKWADFANLFSGTLPRDIQKTIRQFKAKRREVARATRGMTKFNKVMKGFGGPVLAIVILALEKLAEYLPQIIDYFTGNTEAVKALTAANEAAAQSMDRFTASNSAFFEVMMDTTLSIDQRIAAQERLSRSVAGVRDIDLEAADAAERLQEAYAMESARQANEAALKELGEQYTEYQKKRAEEVQHLTELEEHLYSLGYNAAEENVVIQQKEEIMELDEEYADLLAERTRLTEWLAEADAKAAEAAREKQKLQELENRQMRLNQTVYEMEKEMRLDRLDQYEREIAKIDEKMYANLQEADTIGASERDKQKIIEYYAAERQAVRDKEAEAQAAERKRAEEEAKRAQEQLERLKSQIEDVFMDSEQRAIKASEERFTELIAQAEEAGLDTVALTAQMEAERDRIIREYADKRKADAEKDAADEAKLEDAKLKMLEQLYEGNDTRLAEVRAAQLDREEEEAVKRANELGISELQVRQYYAKKRKEVETEAEQEILDAKQESMATFKDGMGNLFDAVQGLAERGSKNAKRLAVLDVLLKQGQSLAAGIQAAIETTPKTPAYPLMLAGQIAGIAATIVTGFSQVKSILSDAGAETGSMESIQPTQALVPSVSSQTMSAQSMNVSAYVVNSELQGQRLFNENMGRRITL